MTHITAQIQSYISALVSFGERQGSAETEAALWIRNELDVHGVPYTVQVFDTYIPRVEKEELFVDGKQVDCKATCFVSGTISDNHSLVSSLISTQPLIDHSNINVNPLCDSISRGNHYFAPSVAIKKSDVPALLSAQDVQGSVQVVMQAHTSQNILVGNTVDPTHVLVCHYDSIGPGATDNASGTAMLLALAIQNPSLLAHNLFLIGGNEEVSYDYPVYWGHGYRAFVEAYPTALETATSIYVVDCVGDAEMTFDTDIETVRLGFPIKNLEAYMSKTSLVYGSFLELMKVYQSDIDLPDVLHGKYLYQTYETLLKKIS